MSKKRKDYAGYLYILPATLFVLAFSIIPIMMTFYFSLTKYNVMTAPVFVGLRNYQKLFGDTYIRAALVNTLIYSLVVVPGETILALVIASVITTLRPSRWTGFVKSAMFVPVISSMVLVGAVWNMMFTPQAGIINTILGWFHIPGVNWLGTKQTALLSLCIVGIWKHTGYFLVIYIAAINDIPKTLFEAAALDGAGKFKQFWYIIVPSIKPITLLVVILGTIWSFQMFDLVYTMTGGGPGYATTTLVYQVYDTAFRNFKMGYASAIAMLLFVIILIFTLIQNKALSGKEEAS